MSGSGAFIRSYMAGDELEIELKPEIACEFDFENRKLPPGNKWTYVDNGKIIGIGGVEIKDRVWLWGLAGHALGPRHWAVICAKARMILAHLNDAIPGVCVYVMASEIDGAEAIIERIGFKLLSGRVYKWSQ